MRSCCSLLAMSGLLASLSVAMAGTVRSTDGKLLRGEVRFEGERLLIQSAGSSKALPLAEVEEADLRPEALPATAPAEASGLTREFFTTFNLGRPIIRQIDPTVDFEWSGVGPEPAIGSPSFTARWTGSLVVRRTARYTLYWRGWPASRLWLDGKLRVDSWKPGEGWRVSELPLDLTEGPHDLRIDYYQSWNAPSGRLEWAAEGMPRQVIPASALRPALAHPPAAGTGTGLLGEYFSDRQFGKRHTVRHDSLIDFDWINSVPEPCLSGGQLSVRWTGRIEPAFSEKYTFTLSGPEQARLWINGAELKMSGVPGDPRTSSRAGEVALEAGKKVDLRIECAPAGGMKPVALFWASPSQPREIVPRDRLYLPTSLAPEIRSVQLTSAKEFQEIAEAPEIRLTASISGGRGVPKALVFLDRGQEIGRASAGQHTLVWKNAPPGWHLLSVQAVEQDGWVSQSAGVPVHIMQADYPELPWRWASVWSAWNGRVARLRDGALEVRTGEGRIGAAPEADSFEFIYQEIQGDGDAVARIQSLEPAGSPTTAGVMIRDGLGGQAKFAFGGYSAGTLLILQRGSDEPALSTLGPSSGWVKLTRRGSRILVSSSENGRDYKLASTFHMELPRRVYLGVAVTGANREVNGHPAMDGRAQISDLRVEAAASVGDSPAGVRFVDGSLLTGTVMSWGARQVVLKRPGGQELTFAADALAGFQVVPLDADWAETLQTMGCGVMTRAGDFLDGEVEPGQKDALVRVNSVVMGLRPFAEREVAGVAFRKPARSPGLEVRLADGSALKVKALRESEGQLSLTLAGGAELQVPGDAVRSLGRR